MLKANAGLFGAKDVKGAVISDPVTGKSTYYDAKDIPRWVDHVYDGRLLLQSIIGKDFSPTAILTVCSARRAVR